MRALSLLAAVFSGLVVGYGLRDHAVDHHLRNHPFDLSDVYRSGVLAGVMGSAVGYGVGLAVTTGLARRRQQRDLVRFLDAQTGRADLSNDQRAALAYVAQDLRETFSE